MPEFLRAAGEAIVAAVAFLIDAFTAPVERRPETEPLPDSATLVARFRARAAAGEPPPLSARIEAPPPAAAQPMQTPVPAPAPVEERPPAPVSEQQQPVTPPAPAPTSAPAPEPISGPAPTPPAPASAQAPAPAQTHVAPGAGALPQQTGGVDRAAFEALHLAPTPAPLPSAREELLEESPGRTGTVDRSRIEPFLEQHREEMRPPQSPQFAALPVSPARPDLVTHAPVATTPAAPAPTPTHAPTATHAATVTPAPAPAHTPPATSETASTWPELPAWPLPWDAPAPEQPSLRVRLENAWYV